ncbi:hypothetical protein V9T40_001098 [Parthenolecanium corni]|uniref:CRAL-TRIO domain-containing protein n=1 Tax=Parthenolecanium corni TaxID=536013 RepID=A0AAN9Y117_9HEMI
MEYATKDQIREFYAEFGATEETVRRDVQYLAEWLKKQPHLPSIEDEEWLANFLLRGKNDVERTKMLIENYYTARAKMPEIFLNRGTKFFDRIKAVRKLIIICPLPKLTPDGYRLVLFRERFADGKVPDPMDTLKLAQMMFDINLRMDKVRGLTLIYDYENTGLAFVKAFFPVIRRALMIQSMIIWNKKPSELADEISPDCLPREYGGKLDTTTEEEDQLLEFYAEFDATEESVNRDVQYLIKWIEKEPYLPNVTDTDLLTNFLLRGKNSIERTKKLIENYYTAKALMPDFFTNRDVKAEYAKNVRKFVIFIPLPKLTPEGNRIMVVRILNDKVDIPPAEQVLKLMQMVFEITLKHDKSRATTLIYDFEKASTGYITALISEFKKVFMVQNKVNPLRYDKIYVLNASPIVQPIINITSMFVKKQFEKVVVWKRPISELCDVLPKECLPKDYGGMEKSFLELDELFYQYLLHHRDWVLAQEKVKADLSKKPSTGNCKSEMLVNATAGSFRKLCID